MKIRIARVLAILLTLTAVLSAVGCSSYKNAGTKRGTLISGGDGEIEVWTYEFLLSRMKAEFGRNKEDIGSADFWAEQVTASDGTVMTREEACGRSVLESAEKFLAARTFCKQNGIELTSEFTDAINTKVDEFTDYHFDNDKKAFNATLATYGADIPALKEMYELEYYASLAQIYLYGASGELISDGVKNDWLNKNYYRYKQIFIPTYYTEYMTDDYGQVIYYDPDSWYIAYDTENGTKVTDSEGVTSYVDASGIPVYDKENGTPKYVTDGNGTVVKYPYTDAELSAIADRVKGLTDSLTAGAFAAFEEQIKEYDMATDAREMYPDGYYLSALESEHFTDPHYPEMLAKLEKMQIGDFDTVQSADGYYIFMKYKPTSGIFADSDYQFLFDNFMPSLISELFETKCRQMSADFKVDESALKSAKSIKDVEANYYY